MTAPQGPWQGPPPPRDWRRRAACRRSPAGTDLVLIEDRADQVDEEDPAARLSTAVEVDRARAVCGGCPVAGDCLASALRGPEVAGMAGGRTPGERDQLRAEQGLAAPVEVTVYDLVTESEWTVDLFAELDRPPAAAPARPSSSPPVPPLIPDAVIRVVLSMSEQGLTKRQIAARLDGVHGRRVTPSTVDYIRQLGTGAKVRRTA